MSYHIFYLVIWGFVCLCGMVCDELTLSGPGGGGQELYRKDEALINYEQDDELKDCFSGRGIYECSLINYEQDDPFIIKILQENYLVPLPKKKFQKPEHMLKLDGQIGQPITINEHIFKLVHMMESCFQTVCSTKVKGWNGLLVEAHPDAFNKMKKRKRKAWMLGNCLSTKTTPEIVDFDASGLLGGIINDGRKPGRNFLVGIDPAAAAHMIDGEFGRKMIQVLCFPLYSILLALGNPTVHYLSLDVEGSEFPILKTIPFDKVDIKVLDVAVNHAGEIFPGSFQEIDKYLGSQGYDLHSIIGKQDAIYVKRGFIDEINEL